MLGHHLRRRRTSGGSTFASAAKRWTSAIFFASAIAVVAFTTATISATAGEAPATMTKSAFEKTKYLLPTPKEATSLKGRFTVTRRTSVVVDGNADEEDLRTANNLAQELGREWKVQLRVTKRVTPHSIRLHRVRSWSDVAKRYKLSADRDLGKDGYILEISDRGIIIVATTPSGLFYGTATLKQLVRDHAAPGIRIVDWPDIRSRMVLYDQRDNTVNVEYWKHWIGELGDLKVNEIMPFMEDDFQYKKYPYLGKPNTFTHDKAAELVRFAKIHQVKIIPQLESFGHADGLLSHSQLAEMQQNGQKWQFSPCTMKTYEVFGDLYGELSIAFPQSQMFHVGSDEVGGWEENHTWHLADDARCADAVANGGEAEVFVGHLHKLQGLLQSHGRNMAMWGDEILTHPELAAKFSKDITIFDWHYEDTKDFPSLAKFKDWGFKNIYAAPAVHGFNDLYPLYPISFGNIPGFTRAAYEADIAGVCITMWGMIEGGNAENYLYGMAYAAQVMWSSDKTDIADFNRRFAASWFGITKDGAADHVDRLFWWPWRVSGSAAWDKKDYDGYWQKLFTATQIVFWKYEDLAKDLSDDELRTRIAQSSKLLGDIETARKSLTWLTQESKRNQMTLESAAQVMSNYEHMSRKAIAVYQTALAYRQALSSPQPDRAKLASVLRSGAAQVQKLEADYIWMTKQYEVAIAERNGDPRDMAAIEKMRASLSQFVATLERAAADIESGKDVPSLKELSLGK